MLNVEKAMEKIVIASAARTPVGAYLGALSDLPAYVLGALVLSEAVKRAKVDPARIDEVIMGQSYQSGENVNIARMALLAAGWSVEVPGITLDRRCCSGLDAICFAAMKILAGYAEIVVAGGVESMSRAELYVPGEYIKKGLGGKTDPKFGFMPKGHGALPMWGIPFFDRIQRARVMSQPIERFGELNSMMSWAEIAAKEESITREAADRWALRSQQRACEAVDSGKFRDEIVPIAVPRAKGGPLIIDTDEPRANQTEIDLEAECTSLIARHQPMARDLRTILMVMGITNDLERMADHSVNIAEAVGDHINGTLLRPDDTVLQMFEETIHMVDGAIRAFIDEDAALGQRVCESDNTVDELATRILEGLSASMTSTPSTVPENLALLKIAGNLERIADLSTNIGEDVIYMTEGRVIKHHQGEDAK